MGLKFEKLDETQMLERASSLAKECFDLAKNSHEGLVFIIELMGTLGAGKSTFARGFILAWTKLCDPKVDHKALKFQLNSPTYNIVRAYGQNSSVTHIDLYRIEDPSEFENLDLERYFYESAVCLVEWVEIHPYVVRLIENIKNTSKLHKIFRIKIEIPETRDLVSVENRSVLIERI